MHNDKQFLKKDPIESDTTTGVDLSNLSRKEDNNLGIIEVPMIAQIDIKCLKLERQREAFQKFTKSN